MLDLGLFRSDVFFGVLDSLADLLQKRAEAANPRDPNCEDSSIGEAFKRRNRCIGWRHARALRSGRKESSRNEGF